MEYIYIYMGTYVQERNLMLTLNNVTKTDLKAIARRDNRSVNSFINVAIDKAIEEFNRVN